MSWIRTIDEEHAEGRVKELYENIVAKSGSEDVPNVLKIQSLHPQIMETGMSLYGTIMFGESGIARVDREMIATLVSSINQCEYSVQHHGEALIKEANHRTILDEIQVDYAAATITEKQKVMMDYAKQLTIAPWAMKEADVGELRAYGFSDRDIFDINQIVAYFNYMNRILNGLGVELEQNS